MSNASLHMSRLERIIYNGLKQADFWSDF